MRFFFASGCPAAPSLQVFRAVSAAITIALVLAGCGSGLVGGRPNAPPPGSNLPPVWQPLTTITFTETIASSVSIATYVSDPDGDALTVTKNSAALPAGVTYDAASLRFNYEGIGAVGSTSGHLLTATDNSLAQASSTTLAVR